MDAYIPGMSNYADSPATNPMTGDSTSNCIQPESSTDSQTLERIPMDAPNRIADTLESLGVVSFHALSKKASEHREVNDLLTICMADVVEAYRKFCVQRESREDELGRVRVSLETNERERKRQTDEIEDLQHDLSMLRERERQSRERVGKMEKEVSRCRDEVSKTKANMDHKDRQYKHELRRRELEHDKLKDKLTRVLADRKAQTKAGMALVNGLSAEQRSALNAHDEMYRAVAQNYEERQAELIEENSLLRQALYTTQRDLVHMLNHEAAFNEQLAELDDDDNQQAQSEDEPVPELMGSGHFQLPFDMVKDDIETHLELLWVRLREGMEERASSSTGVVASSSSSHALNAAEVEIARLSDQLHAFQSLVAQQELMLQQQKSHTTQQSRPAFLDDSALCDERDMIDNERALLEKQKAHVEQERAAISDVSANLVRERIEMEKQRRQFDQDRIAFLTLQQKLTTHNASTSPSPLKQQRTSVFAPTPDQRTLRTPRRTPLASVPSSASNVNRPSSLRRAALLKTSTPHRDPHSPSSPLPTPSSVRLHANDFSPSAAQNFDDSIASPSHFPLCDDSSPVRQLCFNDENTIA